LASWSKLRTGGERHFLRRRRELRVLMADPRVQGADRAEDGSEDGCIFWTDEQGVRWCKDVHNFYGGGLGSLSFVARGDPAEGSGGSGAADVWVAYDANATQTAAGDQGGAWGLFTFAARDGAGYRHDDGVGHCRGGIDEAIYWCDDEGTRWCRDRYGFYGGGEGAEYYSLDGGNVWYGDGEEWVEFSSDALEFMRTTMARKLRAKATARSTYPYRLSSEFPAASTFAPPFRMQPLSSKTGGGMAARSGGVGEEGAGDGQDHVGKSWENERGVLREAGKSAKDVEYETLYGGGKDGAGRAAKVKAEEARVNALFDRSLRAAPTPLWPEMPLRL